jgi:glycosyltransferase involved in cell wall biosynthesis
MKVLYVAPYRTGTDYSDAAINYILALDKVGIEVVPRCILDAHIDVPLRIKELEKRSPLGCDRLVLHTPPLYFEYDSSFKRCIGITNVETNSLVNTTWAHRMKLMDKIVIANPIAMKACEDAGLSNIIQVPYAANLEEYSRSYSRLTDIENVTQGNFIFYMIARSDMRKNLIEVLRAFHTEFKPDEPVSIVVKTGTANMPPKITRDKMEKLCANLKMSLRIYANLDAYKEELIVTEWLTREELCSLHSTGNCFINVSSNENWSMPTFDAMAFGKTPIALNWAGPSVYLTNKNSFNQVRYELEPCFSYTGNSEAFTSDEDWAKPSIRSLQKIMRKAYQVHTEQPKLLEQMADEGLDTAYNYSLDNIGNKLKEVLE